MKNFTFLAVFFLSTFIGAQVGHAQFAPPKQSAAHQRCNTMEAYEHLFQTVPGFRQQFLDAQSRIERAAAQRQASGARTLAVSDTVPVVIHVITSAANQALITDAVLQSQITVLTEDFQGTNADSTRIPAAFKSRFGKMGLTFLLARRGPNGAVTNGIERRTNAVTFTANTADNAKQTSAGGLDAWDPSRYLNLWVVDFGTTGLLGISVFPGDPRPINLHGFVCDYRAFGRGASYLYSAFNKGRTTTHELGHFWNLRHIWGDDGTACTGSDFPATSFPTAADDTPNQAGSTTGNPDVPGTGTVVTDACSNAAPGIMYQNYMDYSDDVALVMFTTGQGARMEGALLASGDRSPILSSTTYLSPIPNDAGILSITNPRTGGAACASSIAPQVLLNNYGNNALTSVTINVTINGVVPTGYPYSWTGNLAPAGSVTVTLPAVNLTAGINTIVVNTSQPNGVADTDPSNDSRSTTFTQLTPIAGPINEGFEGTTFPPAGWTINNPDAGVTWQRTTPGRPTSTGKASINNFDVDFTGQNDELRLPVLNSIPGRIYTLSYDIAHRNYNNPLFYDVLTILVSADCGQTFTQIYQASGPTLATAAFLNTNYATPAAADWAKRSINIPASLVTSNQLQVVFRNTSGYGNWIHLDNINLQLNTFGGDLQMVSVNTPSRFQCTNTLTPSVTVRNVGQTTVTAYNVTYAINGGTPQTQTVTGVNFAPNTQQVLTLPASTISTTGTFNFVVYSSNPVSAAGTGDENPRNDTLRSTFYVPGTTTAPLAETFVSTTFPPTGWTLINSDANITWARSPIGLGNAGSAFYNTYNYSRLGQKDDLITPLVNYPGVDSVTLAFNLAAATYSYPGSTAKPLDTLEVLVTRDCGATYTTVYKKWGAELQTVRDVNSPLATQFVPNSPSQWRRETVNISQFAQQSPLLVVFRGSNNFENNIYIDNVDLFTTTLPTLLKQQGYLVYPTAFRESFMVRYFQDPTSLRYVNVMNSAGQLVWSKKFNNSMDRQIMVDLTGRSAGVYFVELGYQDPNRNITQRVTKF